MLKSLGKVPRRWYGSRPTFSTVFDQLSLGSNVNIGQLFENSQLHNQETAEDELKHLHNLVKSSKVNEAMKNELLSHGLQHDFLLYFTLLKGDAHKWDSTALASLIAHNPGRVYESWELFNKYRTEENTGDEVHNAVIDKLLNGELAERSEFKVPIGNVVKAITILLQMESVDDSIFALFIAKLSEINVLTDAVLLKVTSDTFPSWLCSHLSSLQGQDYIQAFIYIFKKDPALLSKESICKCLDFCGTTSGIVLNKQAYAELDAAFELGAGSTNIEAMTSEVLSYIETNKLDTDTTPESLLIRIKLVEVYGMQIPDGIQKALNKFHEYQTHEKFGIEFVQYKLIQSFLYQAFKEGNETYLKIAQTLMLMENIPIKILQALILVNAKVNAAKSLEIYNDYINKVSTKLNPDSKRSPSGLLTESLMLANLYNNDREFAFLIFDKAVDNKMLSDELETATVKKLFRVYGDAFVEDSWESAQPKLDLYILNTIRNL